MNTSAFEVAQAILLSVGGGAAIIFALSSFLGKVWAKRILQNEKQQHDKELSQYKAQLDSLIHKDSLNYQQKLDLYKVVSNPLIEMVALIAKQGLTKDHVHEFDRQRLHITAQLALFAPQPVFQAFNDMVDYFYDSLENGDYSFYVFRDKALVFLSEMRKDIGIYGDEVKYKGNR
ncbi:TPA: hypothetical protein NKO75_004506 [Vibrio parahaemolyticus]|uniref:hypothetical protein n=2 Tax=Gammaproteobacteria TaxID=1236 RepID=UPI00111E02E2|nr:MULTISPECIES: hypothetical protein [Vibrio harveyi group]QFQ77100.1 hypothetical protein F9277_06550 [Vibrio harveyi]TOG76209.1 hypothetical protein CGI94_23370 [Vibrio parahaemolyticus]HCH0799045.1 hypothetical protein [Vibrio parahaemolyticus]